MGNPQKREIQILNIKRSNNCVIHSSGGSGWRAQLTIHQTMILLVDPVREERNWECFPRMNDFHY